MKANKPIQPAPNNPPHEAQPQYPNPTAQIRTFRTLVLEGCYGHPFERATPEQREEYGRKLREATLQSD